MDSKNHNGRKKQGHGKIRCGAGDTKASNTQALTQRTHNIMKKYIE